MQDKRNIKYPRTPKGEASRYFIAAMANLPSDPSQCVEWPFARDYAGYGTLRNEKVHRHAYIFVNGEIGTHLNGRTLDICHKCDNPPCFRPDHLFAGTRKDNIQDCIQKGRFKLHGGVMGARKISEEVAVSIIREYADGINQDLLAEKYGICSSNVSMIVSGKSWAHLERPESIGRRYVMNPSEPKFHRRFIGNAESL